MSNEEKQTTAVQWLIEIINHSKKYKRDINQKDIEEALRLERQQIEDASITFMQIDIPLASKKKAAETYFESTFTQ